jgi:hypothetical protein
VGSNLLKILEGTGALKYLIPFTIDVLYLHAKFGQNSCNGVEIYEEHTHSFLFCDICGVCVTNITGSGLDDWVYWHFFTITTNYNSSHIELVLNYELQLLSEECLLDLRMNSLL